MMSSRDLRTAGSEDRPVHIGSMFEKKLLVRSEISIFSGPGPESTGFGQWIPDADCCASMNLRMNLKLSAILKHQCEIPSKTLIKDYQ